MPKGPEPHEQPRYNIPKGKRIAGKLHSEKATAHEKVTNPTQSPHKAVTGSEELKTPTKTPSAEDRAHRAERLKKIPHEIGVAYTNGDHHTKARLYREKVEHLEVIHGQRDGGEFTMLSTAHKDAAEHAEAVDDKEAALHHYPGQYTFWPELLSLGQAGNMGNLPQIFRVV